MENIKLPNVTELLIQYRKGDKQAMETLLPLVYQELRSIAERQMRRENQGHTLQATALVHEAYLKLVDQKEEWANRSQFFGIAAKMMRRILIDYARKKHADKREGARKKVSIDDIDVVSEPRDPDWVALDSALTLLEERDPRQARLVELRYFGGLSIEETAEVIGISPATVKRDWLVAKAWLYQQLMDAES